MIDVFIVLALLGGWAWLHMESKSHKWGRVKHPTIDEVISRYTAHAQLTADAFKQVQESCAKYKMVIDEYIAYSEQIRKKYEGRMNG